MADILIAAAMVFYGAAGILGRRRGFRVLGLNDGAHAVLFPLAWIEYGKLTGEKALCRILMILGWFRAVFDVILALYMAFYLLMDMLIGFFRSLSQESSIAEGVVLFRIFREGFLLPEPQRTVFLGMILLVFLLTWILRIRIYPKVRECLGGEKASGILFVLWKPIFEWRYLPKGGS
ncbi:MAG: hypothetical protein K6F35_10275 [Lachnospiraceae bacterium]|nr:hypothetical protein [Lachnospiraceae bacterium]